MLTRPSNHEKALLRQRYSQPTKQVAKVWMVRNCGAVVYENEDIRLCWYYIQQNRLLNTKPTLK